LAFSFFFSELNYGTIRWSTWEKSVMLSRGRHERGLHTCPSLAMADSNQPNTTLYINNLNDKVNKNEIRSQLYALFTTYGKLIDVVATKTPKMRGQAFLVFTDLPSATAALRACDGMIFYNKPLVSPYRSCPIFCFLC
jgi:RNA recognition motif-containing protein